MSMGCSKMVEPIEMPCRMWTCTRNHILGGSPDHHIVRATFRGHSCMQAVFSTLFTQGQQQCGLWLPVCYRNLLSYTVSELWLLFLFWTGPKLFVKPTQKSNRSIITNAVSHCCLAGHVNKDKVDKALEVHQVITVMILVLVVTPNVAAATVLLSLKFIYVAHHITAVTLPHVGCENRAWGS